MTKTLLVLSLILLGFAHSAEAAQPTTVACLAEVENTNVISPECQAVFQRAAPAVDSMMYSQGRRENLNCATPFFPNSFPVAIAEQGAQGICVPEKYRDLLIAATMPFSELRKPEPQARTRGSDWDNAALFALWSGPSYVIAQYGPAAHVYATLGTKGVVVLRVAMGTSAVGAAGLTGYFVGRMIVEADKTYLDGMFIRGVSYVMTPIFAPIYKLTN